MHIATGENLDRLVQISERLLKKPVSRVNFETGLCEPVENGGTNEEALRKYDKKQEYYYIISHLCTYNFGLTDFFIFTIIFSFSKDEPC